jgi:diguanylate cyclase (GGDEF)-like protein
MMYDTRDCVTGLLDQSAFLRVIDDVAEHRAEEEVESIAVMVLDVDGGRRWFSAKSAALSDQLARVLAERVEDLVASAGVVARLGSNIFGILPHGDPNDRDVRDLPGRLHNMLRTPFDIGGEEFCLTTSIGVAEVPPLMDAGSAVKYAHDAVFRVKANGGDATYVLKVA